MGTFSLQIAEFARKAGERAHAATREVVLELGSRIIVNSPVGNPDLWSRPAPDGYVGGRFRSNWFYSLDAPVDATVDATSITEVNGEIPTKAAGHLHFLQNNLPYAMAIERGHSTQAPQGVVGLRVGEFQGIVDGAAEKVRNAP